MSCSAIAMLLLREPAKYDVLVTGNLFGAAAKLRSNRRPFVRTAGPEQVTPSEAGAQHLPNGVDDLPAWVLGGASPRFRARNQAFQRRPLRIGQIRGINCSSRGSILRL